ncbi:hypothetical protein Taro_044596 [Colocasia esculenta]|uniref:Uncharacterized protein n=1 Tax=Colocasia esculenta TaxID=4460 RepID=A0A843WUF4_COLES|nr:hypothetical protein [Colocasia esculenta]
MLEDIISTHAGGNIFLLCKKEVLFTVEDVGIILGLLNCGHPVRHYGSTKKKSRLYERFGMATNFDRKKVHSLIQELVKLDDEVDVEDTVRLWIVLLVCTFLAPRSAHSCPQQMLSCLDDIQRIREYNWAAAVQEVTLHNFDNLVTFVKNQRSGATCPAKRRSGKESQAHYFMYGCAASLAVWFLEHTRVTKNLTVERNEMETIYKGNQTVPEDTSTVPPATSLSLLQEIAASMKSQEVKFDQLNTQLNDQMRQIEEIMRYIHRRDEPVSHEEGAAGTTPTFSEHVHAQPPMMYEDPVTQQEWVVCPPTYSQYVPDVPDVQPPITNDNQAPPIGHFEEDITTAVEDVDAENPNSMVQAIKEREDWRPGLYDQSPYVREKPVTIPEKEKAVATEEPVTTNFGIFEFANGLVIRKSHILNLLYGCMTKGTATTIRRMLKEYGAFPDTAKWELRFDNQCPQQASETPIPPQLKKKMEEALALIYGDWLKVIGPELSSRPPVSPIPKADSGSKPQEQSPQNTSPLASYPPVSIEPEPKQKRRNIKKEARCSPEAMSIECSEVVVVDLTTEEMKLISWNCRGIGGSATVSTLRHLIHSCKPNITFLSETEASSLKASSFFKMNSIDNNHVVDSRKRAGGLWIWWDQNVNIQIIDSDDHLIDAKVEDPKL